MAILRGRDNVNSNVAASFETDFLKLWCKKRERRIQLTKKAARGVGWSQDKQHRESQIVLGNLSSADEIRS